MLATNQQQLTHGSLFSGIGGFDLAAELAGWRNMFNCEIDPFCRTILNHYFSDAQQYTDIKTTDFSEWRGKIDILSGGFPCQPFSSAGKRRGTDDNRYLWPAMLRAVQQIQPRWIVGENVLGIVNWNAGMVFEQVCTDLEAEGYQVQPFVLPACGINAPHLRYRTFFVAYRPDAGAQNVQCTGQNGVCGSFPFDAPNSDIDLHFREKRRGTSEANRISPLDRQTNSSAGQPFRAGSCDTERSRIDASVTDTHRSGLQAERTEQPTTGTAGTCSRTGTDYARGGFVGACGFSDSLHSSHTQEQRLQDWNPKPIQFKTYAGAQRHYGIPDWENFPTQPPVCRGDDGLSLVLDANAVYQGRTKVNRRYPYARWRTEAIKGYGNAIVPPLVYRIFCVINNFEKALWEN